MSIGTPSGSDRDRNPIEGKTKQSSHIHLIPVPKEGDHPNRAKDRLVPGVESLLPAAYRDLRHDLAAIENNLVSLGAEHGLQFEKAARELLFSGGKRLRPLLSCAILRALDQDPLPHIEVISSAELAHTGSLFHDDIIDEARTRRGRRTAHLEFDVPTAILAGDLLLIIAIERVAKHAPRTLRIRFSEALREVCTGEALERERLFDPTVDVVHARRVNRLKTASLFQYAAEAGAILGGAEFTEQSACREYGLALGEAFQLADDLLDLDGDPSTLGKTTGLDLAAGAVTTPVAIALEREPALRRHAIEFWETPEDGRKPLMQLRKGMESVGAFAATREMAANSAQQACDAASKLPPGLWRDQLEAFAEGAIRRDS
jgi:octaprenyl-diphosphate synthase